MLVLTRNIEENILIGENGEIRIRVLGIRGNQVKIGIAAPKEIRVNREEIYEEMKRKEVEDKNSCHDNVACR